MWVFRRNRISLTATEDSVFSRHISEGKTAFSGLKKGKFFGYSFFVPNQSKKLSILIHENIVGISFPNIMISAFWRDKPWKLKLLQALFFDLTSVTHGALNKTWKPRKQRNNIEKFAALFVLCKLAPKKEKYIIASKEGCYVRSVRSIQAVAIL